MLPVARLIIILGLILVLVGGLLYVFGSAGIPLGRLPGTIRIERENFTCVFPLVASILLSILLTVILNIVIRFMNR
jgi:hypothetical protein